MSRFAPFLLLPLSALAEATELAPVDTSSGAGAFFIFLLAVLVAGGIWLRVKKPETFALVSGSVAAWFVTAKDWVKSKL